MVHKDLFPIQATDQENISRQLCAQPPDVDLWRVHERLISSFTTTYCDAGYTPIEPVTIASGVDPTVAFVGSHVSVFKPHFLGEAHIAANGIFMAQPCLRTQNIKYLFDDSILPYWASYFVSLGAMRSYNALLPVAREATKFLLANCVTDPSLITLRVSGTDADLHETALQIADEFQVGLEVDTQKPSYYRHEIGTKDTNGRNFNFAVWHHKRSQPEDIGNIIILEERGNNGQKSEKVHGVELAIGASTLLSKGYGVDTIQLFDLFRAAPDIEAHPLSSKFGDCVLSSLAIAAEEVKPGSSNNVRRALKDYLHGMNCLRETIGISPAIADEIIEEVGSRVFEGKGIATVTSHAA
jgi:hypothetical protein